MGAKGEVRVTSFVLAGDRWVMDRLAVRAGGHVESVIKMPATNPPRVELVTVFPSSAEFTSFQALVENQSRRARARGKTPGGRPAQRRLRQTAA